MPRTRATEDAAISVHRLPAQTTDSTEAPRWEVSRGNQATGWTVIGWIEERRLPGVRRAVYFAIAIHPKNGLHYELDGDTDFDDRANVVADFHRDPMTNPRFLLQH
jgi:hypothetical protein